MVRLTRRITRLTLATAVVAILSSLFTGLQWWETHRGGATADKQANAAVILASAARRQVRVAKQQVMMMRDSVAVAKTGIDLAQGELRLAEQNDARQSRTYIRIGALPIGNFDVGKKPTAAIQIINSGSTQACGLSIVIGVSIQKYPVEGDITRFLKRPSFITTTCKAPGDSTSSSVTLSVPLSQAMVDAVRAGDQYKLYSYAVVTFHDIAGRIHHSYHCSEWSGESSLQGYACPIKADD
jgi:hypothetical protein